MKENRILFVFLLITCLLVIAFSAFKNGVMTCDRYMFNSYMYILTSIVIVANVVLFLQDQWGWTLHHNMDGKMLLASIVVMFGSLIGIMMTSRLNLVMKHVWWIIFLMAVGIMIFPVYMKDIEQGTLRKIMITLMTMTVIFTLVARFIPATLALSALNILLYCLLGLIVVQLIYFFTFDPKNIEKNKEKSLWISRITVVIFTLFLLFDSKLLHVMADNCKKIGSANYPMASLDIFLDLLNLFTGMSQQ